MRYEALSAFLQSRKTAWIRLSFREIESVIGRKLPVSARRHQAWWANTASHSQAEAWMGIGWKTRGLDLERESVIFERAAPLASAGVSEEAAALRRTAPQAGAPDLVTFDRARLSVAARRILNDYTAEFAGDVQRALNRALEEARFAARNRFMGGISTATPSTVDHVDPIRDDRDESLVSPLDR